MQTVLFQLLYRPETASLLVRDVDGTCRSAEELARSVLVVVEAGAVGRVLLTREGAADGQRNARPRRHFFKLLLQVQRLTHSAYRRTIYGSLRVCRYRRRRCDHNQQGKAKCRYDKHLRNTFLLG